MTFVFLGTVGDNCLLDWTPSNSNEGNLVKFLFVDFFVCMCARACWFGMPFFHCSSKNFGKARMHRLFHVCLHVSWLHRQHFLLPLILHQTDTLRYLCLQWLNWMILDKVLNSKPGRQTLREQIIKVPFANTALMGRQKAESIFLALPPFVPLYTKHS